MKILEYNDVDPARVTYLTKLGQNFPLTPERAARLRRTDPRLFPCLAIYAVEDDLVIGQVGIFRLPLRSTQGCEDAGGIWAVSTHPQYADQRILYLLLEEAHARMRADGLRFAALSTDRYSWTYNLYQRLGYEETYVWATALADWETAHQPTRLYAISPEPDSRATIEMIFSEIARDYLGFTWRPTPFAPLQLVEPADIWIIQANSRPVGYVLAQTDGAVLNISNLTLQSGADAAEAIAAVTARLQAAYVQVKISRPADIASLRRVGYHIASPSWDSFMLKPLVPEVTFDDARRLFGIGTDRFLISWLDITI